MIKFYAIVTYRGDKELRYIAAFPFEVKSMCNHLFQLLLLKRKGRLMFFEVKRE